MRICCLTVLAFVGGRGVWYEKEMAERREKKEDNCLSPTAKHGSPSPHCTCRNL